MKKHLLICLLCFPSLVAMEIEPLAFPAPAISMQIERPPLKASVAPGEWVLFSLLLDDIKNKRNHLAGYLIQHNPAVVHYKDRSGKTALDYAIAMDNLAVCKELIKSADKWYVVFPQKTSPEIQVVLKLYCRPSFFDRTVTIPRFEQCLDTTIKMLSFSPINFTKLRKKPLTDQKLLKRNGWQLMHKHCSQETKDEMLMIALEGISSEALTARDWAGSDPLHKKRTKYDLNGNLIALAICIGADPNLELNTPILYDTALNYSVRHSLHSLTRYLLDKGARKACKTILADCTNVEIARKLILRGTPIPVHILNKCLEFKFRSDAEQLELIPAFFELYLGFGAQLIGDITNDTALHNAAHQNNEAVCKTIVFFFIEQHRSFLTFLWCLKQKYPALYCTNQRAFIKKYFGHATPLKKLTDVLTQSNRFSQRPFDIFPLEILRVQRDKNIIHGYFTPRELYMRLKDRVHDERVV